MNDQEEIQSLLKEQRELKEKLRDPEKAAQRVYNLIFHQRFRIGGDWIDRNKRLGRRDAMIVSLLGGVRHLWAVLHPEERIRRSADRQGINSIVQGPASNLCFVSGYLLRKLIWEWFESRGVKINFKPCNSVHDAQEFEIVPVNIPLFDYLRTHASSTLLHKWMRDVMEFPTNMSFEMDAAIGGTLAHMEKAIRWDDQIAAIRKGLEWKRDNLGSKQPIDAIMEIVEYNAEIIFNIRRQEIKEQLRRDECVSYSMYMNADNALKLGLKFKMPQIKESTHRQRERWRDELDG